MADRESPPSVRTVTAVRYVTALREGGSLPAIVEADDGSLFVVKFRGAGQGTRVLVAEMIAAVLARALKLPVPEPVVIDLAAAIARTEPDQEVGDLLRASVGLNFGLGYVPGAVMFTRGAESPPDGRLASAIVWLDGFLMNVDRTVRNPNLLVKAGQPWLIDHGAALYWHHAWEATTDRSADRFALIKDHVLLPWADALPAVSVELTGLLDEVAIDQAVDVLPDDWLGGGPHPTPAAQREAYRSFLRKRRQQAQLFVEEAIHARSRL